MATDYLAELQRDLSNRITRYLPTRVTRRIDAAQDTTADTTADTSADDPSPTDPSPADPSPVERHIPSSSYPLGARLPARGHVEDDWRARPTADHPWPVILLHGTCDTNGIWEKLAWELRTDGWAVFAPEFGNRCTLPVEESAEQIGAYIDAVLTITGARQVVLVGHSQGGVLARYWMRVFDGAPKVRHLVCLAAPNHGTTMGGMLSSVLTTRIAESMMQSAVQSWFGPSGFQLITGHPVLTEINADGDVEEGVGYTCVATRYDAIIQPPDSCFLHSDDPDADITNLFVQDIAPKARVLHVDMPTDSRVRRIVRDALDAIPR